MVVWTSSERDVIRVDGRLRYLVHDLLTQRLEILNNGGWGVVEEPLNVVVVPLLREEFHTCDKEFHLNRNEIPPCQINIGRPILDDSIHNETVANGVKGVEVVDGLVHVGMVTDRGASVKTCRETFRHESGW